MPQHALILGATSDIARAIAHRYAKEGWHLYLAARDLKALEADVSDLKLRYDINVKAIEFDATQYNQHKIFARLLDPRPELVFCVFGYLGDQEKAIEEWEEAERILQVNYTGAISILNRLAEEMAARNKGCIVGISSVAGDRGRGSNYFYGSAKAGFSAYLSGLRNRLSSQGSKVHVMTVKPGYVRTAMTEGMKLNPLLTASPNQVAEDIFKAVNKRQNVLYTRWMWRFIMLIIKLLPEPLFKQRKW